jgi:hypothetical protein
MRAPAQPAVSERGNRPGSPRPAHQPRPAGRPRLSCAAAAWLRFSAWRWPASPARGHRRPRGGRAIGALLDTPALGGAAASLSAARGGARLTVHTVLDPQLAQLHHTALATFAPSLQNVIPAGSTMALDSASLHRLAPRLLRAGLQFDYAVFRGLVVVSTSLSAISAVVDRTRSLGGELGFRAVAGAHRRRVGSLLFLDFSQLLSLGEQMGLTHSARLSALGPDLEKISAVGLTSTSGKTDTTPELFLQIP